MAHQRPKVLYVVGAGRSGSTILDIALGNSPEIFSAGELVHLHERGWLDNHYCGCGERVNECRFWREVRNGWSLRSPSDAVGRFVELQRRFERLSSLFFPGRLFGDPDFHEYLGNLKGLLHCVLDASGKRHLVDSSKKPARGFFVSLLPDFEVYLVHLVRDSRGVAWSKAKGFAKDERAGVQEDCPPAPMAKSARRWLLTNVVCSYFLSPKLPRRYLRLRYEDFVADPDSVLRQIAEHCEVDLGETIRRVTQGEDLEVGHVVAGNRLRVQSRVRIRPDLEWKQNLRREQESTIWRWTGWLLRRYGYVRR